MDLILTGRGVSGEEAKMMGLANRLGEPGESLSVARKLALQLVGFPQGCMRSDRESAYSQWDLGLDAALENETRLGLDVIRSGETRDGATRFANGEGRHGVF
jgi:enoyl-CoA hydratase